MARKKVTLYTKTAPKLAPVAYVDPKVLKGAEYNPRKIAKSDLEQLAYNIARFGFLENVVACKETNEIIGGHQRVKAALMLQAEDYAPPPGQDDAGNPLEFTTPETVPVIYVSGLSDFQKKALNLSLNRISGDWDYDKLVPLVADMYEQTLASIRDDMDVIERQVQATKELMITGFAVSELADYIDNSKGDKDGTGPLPMQGVPKLTLEFTTPELRNKFKAYVASICEEGVASGDAVAHKLDVEA
jgi:hypothetical protein